MPDIVFQRSDKQRKTINVVYLAEGYNGSLRVSKSLFTDKKGPDSLTLTDDLLVEQKPAKAKMTAEERKAARQAKPKMTDEQRLLRIEARAAALRKKLGISVAA